MYIHPQVSISSYLGWIPGIGDKAGAADAVHRTEFVVFRSVPTDPDGAEDVAARLGARRRELAADPLLDLTDAGDEFGSKVRRVFCELERRAEEELRESGASVAGLQFAYTIDARYAGQNFELPVLTDLGDTHLREQIRARFHEEHRKVYGFVRETSALELVTFRLRAIVPTAQPRAAKELPARQHARPAGTRAVVFDEADGPIPCDLYDRACLAAGQSIRGPVIIEQMDTTTIVTPGFGVLVHPSGNLFLSRDERLAS